MPEQTISNPETTGTRKNRISGKKAVALMLLVILAGPALFFGYDERLQPYDDLLPEFPPVPDDADNGFVFLESEWKGRSSMKWEQEREFVQMAKNKVPWDMEKAVRWNAGWEPVLEELQAALKKEGWLTPVLGPDKSGWHDKMEAQRAATQQLDLSERLAWHQGDSMTGVSRWMRRNGSGVPGRWRGPLTSILSRAG